MSSGKLSSFISSCSFELSFVKLFAVESLSITGSPLASVKPVISAIFVIISSSSALSTTLHFICTSI